MSTNKQSMVANPPLGDKQTESNVSGKNIQESNNNNVNKAVAITAVMLPLKSSRSDEVIQEFDISDCDLESLNAKDGDKQSDKVDSFAISMEFNESYDNSYDDSAKLIIQTEEKHKKKKQMACNFKDKQTEIVVEKADEVTETITTPVASLQVSETMKSVASTAVTTIEDEAIADTGAIDKPKETQRPAQLDLNAQTKEPIWSDSLPYCPITPSRVVDVDDTDDQYTPKSNDTVEIGGSAVNRGDNNIDDNDDDRYNDEDRPDELLVQFLGEANRIAEARLAARRQARAEAREIRMRELERQQKEQEQNADRVFDMHSVTVATGTNSDALTRTRLGSGVPAVGILNASTRLGGANSMSSRRSSEDSLEEEGRSLRDIRHELKDVEERFRKAMIANAQLDNDRASQTYEVKLLKDKIETMQETYAQLQRELKEKTRDYNALKRNLDRLTLELKLVQGQLSERDTLISEQGLIIVAVENADGSDAKRALVSVENANVLASVQGSLDVRLKKFNEEKQQLVAEVQKLQEQLETYKSEGKGRGNLTNGPLGPEDDYEAQREANKIISDYKYKLQKAEQEIASLQASLARSETQVIRYKSTAEAAEKAEADLKVERRKLQRENREAMERLEELETSNNHLLKRLDKLKNAKSALLKDL